MSYLYSPEPDEINQMIEELSEIAPDIGAFSARSWLMSHPDSVFKIMKFNNYCGWYMSIRDLRNWDQEIETPEEFINLLRILNL